MMQRIRGGTDERGSIPFVLLALIVVAGLVAALFIDVSTGVRLARSDRDFNQAIQIADVGMQEAFSVLSLLDDDERPPIGQTFPLAGPQTGTAGDGAFSWEARRTGPNRWQVRSAGSFGDAERFLEATMGPDTLFGLAAFGDVLIELRGANAAFSYNATSTNNGRGSVGSNNQINLRGNAEVDWVMRYNEANYNNGGVIRTGGGIETGDEQVLPNIGLFAYEESNGACAGGAEYDDITDVLPLLEGETYCVAQARFPAGEHLIASNPALAASLEPGEPMPPTRIFIAPSGNLELLGQGNNPCDRVACVNVTQAQQTQVTSNPSIIPRPDATKLEIYLAGGGGQVLANNHTVIAAGIYAPASNCSGANAQGHVFGSIVCRTLDSKGGWSVYYDERFDDVTSEFFAVQGVREETASTTTFG